ncbi:MAG: hypothetical protein GF346_11820 [Candidatus Eisenbacteria bacterium]|nr:hypothetical protein [Candidatus Latescibacterota bacterium]MBD3303124.1 hypothetical protein [Candidatus Eisenbacteria bacterium]
MRLAWFPLVVGLWCLAGAGEATAQGDSPPADFNEEEDASTAAQVFQSLAQFGSFGASAGGMLFLADEDASDGARVRPTLQGTFRYRFNADWVGVGDFGFGWNAFESRGDTVLTVHSGTLGIYRHVSQLFGFDWKVGTGGGLYRWNYKFEGKSVRDPETQLPLRDFGFGVFGGLEVERRLSRHVTVIWTNRIHQLFTENKDDYPTLLGGNDRYVSSRIGVSYHFSPYEGILWERQEKRVIRLESGRTGS